MSKLKIAKQLRQKHGTITYCDHSISFQDGKFTESSMGYSGCDYGHCWVYNSVTWREVLRLIKSGTYS